MGHINKQLSPAEVEEEFSESWGVDAPELLRSVLHDLLSEGIDQQEVFADESASDDEKIRKSAPSYREDRHEDAAPHWLVRKMKDVMASPESGTIEWGGYLPGEATAP